MKNKFIFGYGITACFILLCAVLWFSYSVSLEAKKGSIEAERSFSWLSREAASIALSDGFMSDTYIQKLTGFFQQSRLLSAVVISTPSGPVLAWPQKSSLITYDVNGKPEISSTSLFMKVFSTTLDIGDGSTGAVVITAVLYVLHPDTIFSASRNSFLLILTLLLVTLTVILVVTPLKKKHTTFVDVPVHQYERPVHLPEMHDDLENEKSNDSTVSFADVQIDAPFQSEEVIDSEICECPVTHRGPEGLFSPVSGIGWEQYLADRLDAELVRAASSEQDLSFIIIRVANLQHTDLMSKKIAHILLDTFKFRDLIFEYGENGFAGILQNINLDQAMKIADALYANIDSILMQLSFEGQITIGITTRTARLLPASRMIEEASSAAQKAVEEPSLPIVAFRANPEKYRNFVAENS